MDKEQTSRALLNASADSAVLIDRNGIVLDANENMAASLGTTRDKLVGAIIYDYMDPAIAKTRKEKEHIAAREKRLVRFVDYRNKKWLENSVYPVFDSEGNLSQYAIFSRDMSSYIEVEYALKQERDRAKTYLDLAEVIIMALDSEGCIGLMNRKGCHILGYAQDKLIGKNFFDSFTPADSRREIKHLFRSILDEKVAPQNYFINPIITKNGEKRTIAWNITVVRDDEGFVTGTLSSGTDITEQKKAEKALLESERYYKTLFESASDAILIVEGPLCIDCNHQALKMFGCTKEQMIGKTPEDFSPPFQPDGQPSREKMFKTIKGIQVGNTQSLEWKHRRHNGTFFDAEVHLAGLDPERPERHVAIVRDITRRKQAEDALNEALNEVRRIKDAIEAENIYLHKEIQNAHLHGDIVGKSDAIKSVLSEAEQVAGTDSTVLILGETGTGKELLARAIHNMSYRKNRPLVIVNCAAIPETLVESELFGREKGAFTGAITRQIGRFEIAHESTIFLDEIGELSLDIQAKLLRVLQEGEIERLGSSRKIHVDARIIAATNRDLRNSLNNNTFRKDLYYRLNVFPISIPPLRNRKEDIPFLVWHFVDQMGERMGKRIEKIPQQSINNLMNHHWPGNIRELHNIIERAMIQTDDAILRVPLVSSMSQHQIDIKKLADVEKQHILRVLEETGWRIRGTSGAAELLDIKPTTLESRLKKLGIKRPNHKSEIS